MTIRSQPMKIKGSDNISTRQHNELIKILNELIVTMQSMNSNYLLSQNLRESEDWRKFLTEHTDREELISLQKEIAERFVYKYDVQIDGSDLDYKRIDLMKEYLGKAGKYL